MDPSANVNAKFFECSPCTPLRSAIRWEMLKAVYAMLGILLTGHNRQLLMLKFILVLKRSDSAERIIKVSALW